VYTSSISLKIQNGCMPNFSLDTYGCLRRPAKPDVPKAKPSSPWAQTAQRKHLRQAKSAERISFVVS
jgi:hypothetical protein